MPSAYLVAVVETSVHDRDSNNMTLVNLVEQVQCLALPVVLSYQIHSYWEFAVDEVNVAHEIRIAIRRPDGTTLHPDPHTVKSEGARLRVRLSNLLLDMPGQHHIGMESRRKGSPDWILSATFWPLLVEIEPLP